MKPLHILRDVGIVFGLTLLGGFVIGLASAGAPRGPLFLAAIGISNLLFSTLGFFITGCLTVESRWLHLWLVGLGLWIASLLNVAFGVATVVQWMFASIFIAITLGIGGGLSALVRRKQPSQRLESETPAGAPLAEEEPRQP